MGAAPLETRWIYSRLSTVSAEVDRALTDYRFDEAANTVYQFFWGEFCDWYLELVKLRMNFFPNEDGSFQPKTEVAQLTLNALVHVFESALRLLSPFMPFLTEELWHALYASLEVPSPAKSIALMRYPQAADFPTDDDAARDLGLLQELSVLIRELRKSRQIPEKEMAPILISSFNPGNTDIALANIAILERTARVSSIEIASTSLSGPDTRSTAVWDVQVLYERQIDIPAERERLTKDIAKFNKGIEAANKQLTNEGFTSRAPAHIIEGLKKQFAETTALKEKAEAALASLPPNP